MLRISGTSTTSPLWLLVLLVVSLTTSTTVEAQFAVSAARLNGDRPVLSHFYSTSRENGSFADATYNPSWLQPHDGSGVPKAGCIVARCQNFTSAPGATPIIPGPSYLSISCGSASYENVTHFSDIESIADVVFQPSTPEEVLGTEDPRIAYVPSLKKYLLFYTAVSKAANGNWVARLSLASASTPTVPKNWTRHGALFPDVNSFQFTKSGALLVGEGGMPSYLIFGDCSLYNGLQVATVSDDFLNYSVLEDFLLIQPRKGMFDSFLVESGPPPMMLDDGNYFFVYNGAQPLQGTNPNGLFYSPGWVVLNGSNPLQVLQRSDVPLMMPTYVWETAGLTPYVIFVEAMRVAPPSVTKTATPTHGGQGVVGSFVIYYGAADTSIGAALVTIESTTGGSWNGGEYAVRSKRFN